MTSGCIEAVQTGKQSQHHCHHAPHDTRAPAAGERCGGPVFFFGESEKAGDGSADWGKVAGMESGGDFSSMERCPRSGLFWNSPGGTRGSAARVMCRSCAVTCGASKIVEEDASKDILRTHADAARPLFQHDRLAAPGLASSPKLSGIAVCPRLPP